MNLMKMMVASGLLDSSTNIMSFWSLRLPNCDLDIDVDCAVMYADRLWLIDAKRYETQEGMLYASDGGDTLINVHQGTNISGAKDHTLSTSMAIAFERYKVAMPELEGDALRIRWRRHIDQRASRHEHLRCQGSYIKHLDGHRLRTVQGRHART